MSPRLSETKAGGGGLCIVLAGRLQMADQLIYTCCWFEVGLPLPRFLCRVGGLVVGVAENSLGLRVGSGKATGASAINSRVAFRCPDLQAVDATGDHHRVANADLRVVAQIVFDGHRPR